MNIIELMNACFMEEDASRIEEDNETSIAVPRTSVQAAIHSCYTNANELNDAYYIKKEGDRVYDILKNLKKPVDDATKMYAIQTLAAIQVMCNDKYYKRNIGNIIQKVLDL